MFRTTQKVVKTARKTLLQVCLKEYKDPKLRQLMCRGIVNSCECKDENHCLNAYTYGWKKDEKN